MSNTRYVNGWECPICFELYQTERKAKNCMKKCIKDCYKNYDSSDDEVNLISGYECVDCGDFYKRMGDAKVCCNVRDPQDKDINNYDKINYPKAFLISDRKKRDVVYTEGESK